MHDTRVPASNGVDMAVVAQHQRLWPNVNTFDSITLYWKQILIPEYVLNFLFAGLEKSYPKAAKTLGFSWYVCCMLQYLQGTRRVTHWLLISMVL